MPGWPGEAQALWDDPARRPAWVDGFGHVVRLDGGCAGASLHPLEQRTPLGPVADWPVVRRSLGESLRRTLTRFAHEREGDLRPS